MCSRLNMTMQRIVIFVLLFTSRLVNCDEQYPDQEGAACTTKTGEAGVCRKFLECEYAKNLVKQRKRITDCFFDKDNTRYSCCVETIKPKTPGPMTPRESVKEGVMKNDNIECRFNGTLPVRCCRVASDFTTLRFDEPSGCKKLEEPYKDEATLPYESVIYDACYAYSRLGSKCSKDAEYSDQYKRDECTEFDSTPKISDGDPAQPKEFPHMAVLGCANKQDIVWVGGGSLISEYFILTAAHAVASRDFGMLKYALLGTINKTDIRNGSLYYVADIIRHPQYNATTKMNDISLLKLHTRVLFSEFVRPACLTFPGVLKTIKEQLIIAGWGKTGQKADTSDVLLKAFVYSQDHDKCVKYLRRANFKWDTKTMICALAGEMRKQQDSCQGDSGGPLMAKTSDLPCSYFISGIVSWGPYCGVYHPGSYTNASNPEYLQWIVRTVWPQQLKTRQLTAS